MDSEKEKGSEKKTKESSRTAGGKRKKSLARKRAKETLSEGKEESLDVESLATKQDVLELYILVKDRFQTTSPEDTGLVLHMMVEKKYPLSQDTLSKMLSRRLEVDHQSEMGYELISSKQTELTTIPYNSTTLDEFTDLQCDYVDQVVKCERLKNELSKSNTTLKSFEALQQHAINLELALQQNLKAQLQDKDIVISELKKLIENTKGKSVETKFEKPSVIRQLNAFKSQRQSVLGVISTTSVSRPQLKSNRLEDRVMHNNSKRKKQQVEDHRRNFNFSNNKTFVTACNDSLNAKTSNVNFICVTYGKCVLNDNHDMRVLNYINGVNNRTKQSIVVPISTREPKRTVNQSVITPLKKTIASESTNQKPRSTTRK
ncbi:hypothetical protein Tco_0515487 [Tanacetum coccineum]